MEDSDTVVRGITGDFTVNVFGMIGEFSLVSPSDAVIVPNSDLGLK